LGVRLNRNKRLRRVSQLTDLTLNFKMKVSLRKEVVQEIYEFW